LVAVHFRDADLAFQKNEKVRRRRAFLDQDFAGYQRPFFGTPNAASIRVLEIGKERNTSELIEQQIRIGSGCGRAQNRFKY
jgi:hypothetical protein